jgi:hypothetical protein
MKKLDEIGVNSEKQIEEARLAVDELLNVEGGIDSDQDQDEDDCYTKQCTAFACATGA